jgi:ubiquinol-cytochrome c reductase subunit 7
VSPIVAEAVARLPDELNMRREQRLKIGFDLCMKKQTLPRNLWVREDDDIPYLTPFIEIVEQEQKERAEFFST